MSKNFLRIGLVVIVLVLALSVLPGCGAPGTPSAPKAEPPAEFRIGIMGGITGPASAPVTRLLDELGDVLKYTNEVEGGIGGVKLQWRVVDNKGVPDGAIIAYKVLRDSFKPNLYVSVEDYLYLGLKDMMVEDKSVLVTTSAIDKRLFVPPGRVFTISLPTADGFAAYVDWAVANWKGTGRPKLGILHYDRGPGEQWKAAQGYVAQKNVELVPASFPITTLDLKPQLMKLKEANVNYIWMLGISENAAVTIRDSRSLGIAGQIPITFMEYVEAEVVLNLVGEAAEGFYDYQANSPYSDGSEGAKLYNKIWKWAKNQDKWSDNRLVIALKGVLNALVQKTAADIKANKLTGNTLYNTMDNLKPIDTWGNNKDLGFAPDRRVGQSHIKMKRYTKNGTVAAGDWIPLPRIYEGK